MRAICEEFLCLDDPPEQARVWRDRLETRAWRLAISVVLHPRILGRLFAPELVAALPHPFAPILRARLARGFARHPNRSNPWAWRMWLGREPPAAGREADARAVGAPGASSAVLVTADAAEFLEAAPPQSFDGFTLSNVLDGAAAGYAERLHAAVRRAASPGAVMVTRSFAEPADAESEDRAAADRAMVWGTIAVQRVREVER